MDRGQMYRVYLNQTAAAAYSSLYFFVFLSLQFSNIKIFRHTFLRNCEALKIETWYTWTVGRCIVYTGLRLLVSIRPLVSSFFFLSNFQTLKFFVTLFSGTVRPRRLKLGTHVDSGQMYRVYWNQTAAVAYSFLYFFVFLSLQFSNIKIFRHTFLRNCEALNIETWYTHGQWADVSCILESDCYCCLFVPLFLRFSFSPIFKH